MLTRETVSRVQQSKPKKQQKESERKRTEKMKKHMNINKVEREGARLNNGGNASANKFTEQ